jgi:hypothetical protein
MAACDLGDRVSPWADGAIQWTWPDMSLDWICLYASCSLVLRSLNLWLLILRVEESIRVHIVTIFELACKLLLSNGKFEQLGPITACPFSPHDHRGSGFWRR